MMRPTCWLLLVAFGLAAASCGPIPSGGAPQPGSAPPAAREARAEMALDFTLRNLEGDPITLSALRGRWVLVNFWATWCLPCRAEMPYLSELAATHGDRLTVLAINMREQPQVIRTFLADLGVDLTVLIDPDDATLLAYHVRGLPITFLIAPDGAIARRIVGAVQPADVTQLDKP